MTLEWAFEEPVDAGNHRSSHFVESINGQGDKWLENSEINDLDDGEAP